MPVSAPPGRAGRLWLMRRLEVARRGAEVLDQKRQTLLRERRRTSRALAESAEAWEEAARSAARWNDRAVTAAGERRLRLAALRRGGSARAEVAWKNTLGTVIPTRAAIVYDRPPDLATPGEGAAVMLAADAHRRALEAAAAYASARAADAAIEAELGRTTRRLRAIERRWIPEHEAALHRLELALTEQELEDIARVHHALGRG